MPPIHSCHDFYAYLPGALMLKGVFIARNFFNQTNEYYRALHEEETRPKGGTIQACLLAGSKVHLSPTTWLRANLEGLGIGSIGFDWATISSYLMSPATSPWFGTVKIAIGFFLIRYDISSILMSKFHLAKEVTQGLGFCISAPSLLRVMELDWPYFLLPLSMSYSSMEVMRNIMMKFKLVLFVQSSVVEQQPGLNIKIEYIIRYMYLGHPVSDMCFELYGYISMTQALTFLANFKPGRYTKIPPKSMC
ncbi:Oligopeptide transporter 6 [Vitis vinifera]|uniref:Oligopeptide transporter 6 n=1 Tax=Vitis vinifera TaxID=29760 RepID=A0A438HX86_VITVI|nr:Oligopeptide transporter 6 [Vitis vinifera]